MAGTLSACAQKSSTISILDSEEVRTEEHSWSLISVEIRTDCTILEKVAVPIEKDTTWISSVREEYIEDVFTGNKYHIIDSEIGFEPGKVLLEGYSGRTFKETYPALPKGVTHINASSGTKYFIKSLDLSLEVSPKHSPVSDISFFGVNIGAEYDDAIKSLKKQGFKQFYKEEREGIFGGNELLTYLYRPDDEYPITIEIESSVERNIVTRAEVMYQNHVDIYEVDEHLQVLADECKAAYPYRHFNECTPEYRNAASMLNQKSGKDRIFKNVTIIEFSGDYYIGDSPDVSRDNAHGIIGFEVHSDGMHNDHVIVVSYTDWVVNRYVRRSIGEYRW
ncbi:MAG: hypothetical protein IJZ70_06710 [Bacteroidales bacterium]|nr:hypothetical protein [Bacteroidales bacterium]